MNDPVQDEISAIADWIIDGFRHLAVKVRGWFA